MVVLDEEQVHLPLGGEPVSMAVACLEAERDRVLEALSQRLADELGVSVSQARVQVLHDTLASAQPVAAVAASVGYLRGKEFRVGSVGRLPGQRLTRHFRVEGNRVRERLGEHA